MPRTPSFSSLLPQASPEELGTEQNDLVWMGRTSLEY